MYGIYKDDIQVPKKKAPLKDWYSDVITPPPPQILALGAIKPINFFFCVGIRRTFIYYNFQNPGGAFCLSDFYIISSNSPYVWFGPFFYT